MNLPTREELMALCERAVVPHTKWRNRDSYSAQKEIESIYTGLKNGLKYRIVTKEIDENYHSDEDVWIIEFLEGWDAVEEFKYYNIGISSLEDFHRDRDPDYELEMFGGDGIDFKSDFLLGFMPTEEVLEKVNGDDWYSVHVSGYPASKKLIKISKEKGFKYSEYSIPRQADIHTWLKNTYGIRVSVQTHYTNEKYVKLYKNKEVLENMYKVKFNTYEDALEYGLYKALKLIQ